MGEEELAHGWAGHRAVSHKPPAPAPQVTNTDPARKEPGPCPLTCPCPPALALWGRSPTDQSSRNSVPVELSGKKNPFEEGQREKHQLFPPRHRGHL